RLRDALGDGELGDPLRPLGVEAAQHEQRAEAAPPMRLCAQEVRRERQAAVELVGKIGRNFDSDTI
ncbi:MAG TPA: hypothetical protein VFG79_23030, partial [Solirubrobacter sp.]|nr:hypothetical protein [Solirubrobacter sp.]